MREVSSVLRSTNRKRSPQCGVASVKFAEARRRDSRKACCVCNRLYMESGGDLLSRTVTSQVPSALKGLTSVFGMGTGGTPSSLPPEMVSCFRETVFIAVLRFRKSRPSSLPFLPPSGPEVFSHPDNCTVSIQHKRLFSINLRITLCNQALDRLVSSSSMRYRTSTDDLSTR